jgi:hypothetical protein
LYIFFVTYLILLFKPGHGGSDGLHGYVHSLDYAVDDLVCFDLYLQGTDGVYFASDESKCTLFFPTFYRNLFLTRFCQKILGFHVIALGTQLVQPLFSRYVGMQ